MEDIVMISDRFLEEVVVKKNKAFNEVLYYLSWVIIVISAFVAIMGFNTVTFSLTSGTGFDWMSLIFTLVTAGIAVYCFFFHDKLRLEYEYTFTNGALDFAEVYNNKKRKSLGSLNTRNIEAFGKVSGSAFQRYLNMPNVKRMNWFLNRDAELFYFYFEKDSQKRIIIIEPSQEMIANIKKYIPQGVWQNN